MAYRDGREWRIRPPKGPALPPPNLPLQDLISAPHSTSPAATSEYSERPQSMKRRNQAGMGECGPELRSTFLLILWPLSAPRASEHTDRGCQAREGEVRPELRSSLCLPRVATQLKDQGLRVFNPSDRPAQNQFWEWGPPLILIYPRLKAIHFLKGHLEPQWSCLYLLI